MGVSRVDRALRARLSAFEGSSAIGKANRLGSNSGRHDGRAVTVRDDGKGAEPSVRDDEDGARAATAGFRPANAPSGSSKPMPPFEMTGLPRFHPRDGLSGATSAKYRDDAAVRRCEPPSIAPGSLHPPILADLPFRAGQHSQFIAPTRELLIFGLDL